MTTKFGLTDDQVEQEIDLLKGSDEVRLARYEQKLKYRRRQYLYQLRNLHKHGRDLMDSGITMEMLRSLEHEDDCEEDF